MEQGTTYQDIPGVDCKFHRGGSELRAGRILELIDFSGKTVIDLGCSVGSISGIVAKHSKSVLGIDHDPDSIELARSLYNCEFMESNIDIDLIRSLPKVDVIIWISQFMWMVKQYGMEYALDCLFEVSKKCDYLIFETAGKEDGSAPIDYKQSEIINLLIKNTEFNNIHDYGPWNDYWTIRNVFLLWKCPINIEPKISSIEFIKRGVVRKKYKLELSPIIEVLFQREVKFLKSLSWSDYFPKVIDVGKDYIDMSNEGILAKWIPDNDTKEIISALKKEKILHRDIGVGNVLWNGKNCVLIDFTFSIYDNENNDINYSYDLGLNYKCPYGYNDEYSIKKLQSELLR